MDIPITTTFSIDGYRIKEYKGIVRGLVVRSPTLMQGFMGGLSTIMGGNIEAYTEMCEQTREQGEPSRIEIDTDLLPIDRCDGRGRIVELRLADGTTREVLRFDEPSRPHNFSSNGIAEHAGWLYFTLSDLQSDIWLATVTGLKK